MSNKQTLSVQEACNIIIGMQTLPPQIDFISPTMKSKHFRAEQLINNLSEEDKKKAQDFIEESVNAYYEVDPSCNESPASLDAKF